MDLVARRFIATSSFGTLFGFNGVYPQPALPFPRFSCPWPVCGKASVVVNAKKKDAYAQPEPVVKKNQRNQIEEDEEEEEEGEGEYEFEDEEEEDYYDDEEEDIEEETSDIEEDYDDDEDIIFVDSDDEDELDFDDEDEIDPSKINVYMGDGEDGGGFSLGNSPWEKEALNIAEQVLKLDSFDGDFKIYAFKTSLKLQIYIRLEKLSSDDGSPDMDDIEAFSIAYREKLDKAESDGKIPTNIYLEVSSPGAERVVRIPEDLERFKDRTMYVKYYVTDDAGPPKENDGILKLISYDLELENCIWGNADVKANRPQKGRPMNKKQKEWRLTTGFDSLKLVRLYLDC